MTTTVAIGVDLGGTKTEAVIARIRRGDELAADEVVAQVRRRVATRRERGYEAIVATVATLVRDAATEAAIDPRQVPIGVGMPGSFTRSGLVKNSNTVCLNGRPFRTDLERELGRPIAFGNDANLFALAEAHLGSARDHRDGVVLGVILGTGVGGGVVVHGAIWPGRTGIAGEWGHHAVWAGRSDARPCYCGQRGCVEAHLSGPSLEAQYRERTGRTLALGEVVARRSDDEVAAAVVEELLATFARGLANVIDVLDPTAIVLGGGLSHLDLLYDEGRDRVASLTFTDAFDTPILRPACGDSAGVLGAALLAVSAQPQDDAR